MHALKMHLENATNVCDDIKADLEAFSGRFQSSDVNAGAASSASLRHGTGPAAAATADPLKKYIAVHKLRCQIASDPRSFFDKADVDTSWDISTEEWIEACKMNDPHCNAANLESLFKEIACGDDQISPDRLQDFADTTNLIGRFVQESKCSEVIAEVLARWLVSMRPTTGGYGVKEAEHLLAGVQTQDAADVVAQASKALAAALSQGAADVQKALAHRSQDVGKESGSKYANLPEATYGPISAFHMGVNILGVPHPQIFQEMKNELVDEGKGAGKTFEAWNSGRNVTTTAKEWDFVVEPYDPSTVKAEVDPAAWRPKHDNYGGERKPIRLQVFAHACSARDVKASGETVAYDKYKEAYKLPRDDPRWLHLEEVDMVRVLLLRHAKSQLDGQSLISALDAKKLKLQREETGAEGGAGVGRIKLADAEASTIVSHLSQVLRDTDGPASNCSFDIIVEALREVTSREILEAIVDYFHDKIARARLTLKELIACRLYTGPVYVKMNTALREAGLALERTRETPEGADQERESAERERGGGSVNKYVNTVTLCASAMLKIASVCRIPTGRKVWRGISGRALPPTFSRADEDGSRGGVEFAFMSCTTNESVAISYIDEGKGLPILFQFAVGSIDRGAALSLLSQYPGEDEVTIPPMSFLEVVGEPSVMCTSSKGNVMVYPARINCNLKGKTIEEIEQARKQSLVSMEPYLREEYRRDQPPVVDALKTSVLSNDHVKQHYLIGEVGKARQKLDEMWKKLQAHGAAWYNDDRNYVDAVKRAYSFKHDKIEQFVKFACDVDPTSDKSALYVAMERGHVEVMGALLSITGAAVDALDDGGNTALQYGAQRGYVQGVKVLMEKGACVGLARPKDGATALALALLSQEKNVEMVRVILEQSRRLPQGDASAKDWQALMHELAMACMSPANLQAWLRDGLASPAGLKGEIGALLLMSDLDEAVKQRLRNVRRFIDRRAGLLQAGNDVASLPHVLQQLASQEPDAVFGGAETRTGEAEPGHGMAGMAKIIEWHNKPQELHPCQWSIQGSDELRSVAYSKCGTKLVRAEGIYIVVCDAVTGFEQFKCVGHADTVWSVAISDDGKLIVSGSSDKTIKIWDASTGVLQSTLRGHRYVPFPCIECLLL